VGRESPEDQRIRKKREGHLKWTKKKNEKSLAMSVGETNKLQGGGGEKVKKNLLSRRGSGALKGWKSGGHHKVPQKPYWH